MRNPEPRRSASQIAVVIPTLDSEDTIRDLADSIHQQTLPPDEVTVVDSSQDSRTERAAVEAGLTVIRAQASRIGARRIGALRSHSPWICLIDADQILDERFIEELADAIQSTGGDAVTALELSKGGGRWRDLLRVQDRVEFLTGEGLPRCWRREVFLEYRWGQLESRKHVNGEDRLLRDWLRRSGRRIDVAPRAVLFHQDPELGSFLRKQYHNARSGSGIGVPSALAPSVARSLVKLLSPRSISIAAKNPLELFGYYWILVSRVVAQCAGLLAARVVAPLSDLGR